jgi:hypothetical protein
MFFWLDSWNGFSFSTQMPELFSFAKNKYIIVQQFCQSSAPQDLFHLPLFEEAYQQYNHLLIIVDNINL